MTYVLERAEEGVALDNETLEALPEGRVGGADGVDGVAAALGDVLKVFNGDGEAVVVDGVVDVVDELAKVGGSRVASDRLSGGLGNGAEGEEADERDELEEVHCEGLEIIYYSL